MILLIWKSDIGYTADTEKVFFLFLRADIIGNTTHEIEKMKKRRKIEEAVVYRFWGALLFLLKCPKIT